MQSSNNTAAEAKVQNSSTTNLTFNFGITPANDATSENIRDFSTPGSKHTTDAATQIPAFDFGQPPTVAAKQQPTLDAATQIPAFDFGQPPTVAAKQQPTLKFGIMPANDATSENIRDFSTPGPKDTTNAATQTQQPAFGFGQPPTVAATHPPITFGFGKKKAGTKRKVRFDLSPEQENDLAKQKSKSNPSGQETIESLLNERPVGASERSAEPRFKIVTKLLSPGSWNFENNQLSTTQKIALALFVLTLLIALLALLFHFVPMLAAVAAIYLTGSAATAIKWTGFIGGGICLLSLLQIGVQRAKPDCDWLKNDKMLLLPFGLVAVGLHSLSKMISSPFTKCFTTLKNCRSSKENFDFSKVAELRSSRSEQELNPSPLPSHT
jgi:hypothetical protein